MCRGAQNKESDEWLNPGSQYDAGAYVASISSIKPGSQYDAGAYVRSISSISSISSIKPGSQYDAGAYVASVASRLVHNMTLDLT